MSRTKKDKPDRLLHPEYFDTKVACTKKPREHDKWHWLRTTPAGGPIYL